LQAAKIGVNALINKLWKSVQNLEGSGICLVDYQEKGPGVSTWKR